MVNFYCEEINEEVIKASKIIANKQNTTVKIITTTKTMEVGNEKQQESKEKT